MTPRRVCPESLRRVPVSTGAQFSLLQPNPKKAPKWKPKWSVLGAKVITILLFVRPCRENRPSKSFNFVDMISEHFGICAGARGGLARPEGGYTLDPPYSSLVVKEDCAEQLLNLLKPGGL